MQSSKDDDGVGQVAATTQSILKEIKPRAPRQNNPTFTSLNELGTEILIIIIDLICDTSPKTLNSIALTSSYYHSLTDYCRHRTVSLDFNLKPDNNLAYIRLDYLRLHGILPTVRKLKIRAPTVKYPQWAQPLCDLFPHMTGIVDFHWTGGRVPEDILADLKRRPSIRLHANFEQSILGRTVVPDSKIYLQDNTNLYSLEVQITYRMASTCAGISQRLNQLILSCPNLRKLNLRYRGPVGGNPIVYANSREYGGLGFVDGQAPPPLEKLKLHGYRFGEGSRTKGYPLHGREEDYWAANFDWSRLVVLKTDSSDFALKIMPKLTSLGRCLFPRTRNKSSEERIKIFYEQVPSELENIIVSSISMISLPGILRHGARLKKLSLHQPESHMEENDPVLDNSMLSSIRDGCPYIEELTLHLVRNEHWPYEALDILAGFPRLRILNIWFRLGIGRLYGPIKPYLNITAAEKMFRHINARRGNGLRLVQRLEVMCGWPGVRGISAKSSPYIAANSVRIRCSLPEDDAKATMENFVTNCPDFGEEENAMLAHGKEIPDLEQYWGLKASRDGPVRLDEWRSRHEHTTRAQSRRILPPT
jgi:hypothetical protein